MCGGGSLSVEVRGDARGPCLFRSDGEPNPALDGVTGREEPFPLAFGPFRPGTERFFAALGSLRLLFLPLGLASGTDGATFSAGLLSGSSLCVEPVDLAVTPQSSRSGKLPSSVSPAQSIADGVNGRGVVGADGFRALSRSASPLTLGASVFASASVPLI